MDSKENSFHDLFQSWNKQTAEFLKSDFFKDSKFLENVLDQFTKLQQTIINTYEAQDQRECGTGSDSSIRNDLYTAIINIANRISDVEARLSALEDQASGEGAVKTRGSRTESTSSRTKQI
ncbi:hypothetical protein [Rickettsiales endosymbiont of Peranema trichophorum]|uniref:hypothetical protein n=1 Tax=Rickettsiales endosymbiont of Peranema trichophorum TaxID=2486577 RepID=UPI0013EE964F|nr:hypothetical protein [Rickettsiales endosymbiont of Peranema trichophorum]